MGTTLGIILVLAALAAVVYPFVVAQRRRGSAPDPAVMRLRAARARIYRQIDELDAELSRARLARRNTGRRSMSFASPPRRSCGIYRRSSRARQLKPRSNKRSPLPGVNGHLARAWVIRVPPDRMWTVDRSPPRQAAWGTTSQVGTHRCHAASCHIAWGGHRLGTIARCHIRPGGQRYRRRDGT